MPLTPEDPYLMKVIAVSNSEIERFTIDRQRRLLEVYQRERDALTARLLKLGDVSDTFTARQLRIALAALDDATSRLLDELNEEFSSAFVESGGYARDQALRELSQLEGKFGSAATAKGIATLTGVIPHKAIDQVGQLSRLEAEGLIVDLSQTTRQIMQRGLIQGLSSRQLVPSMVAAIGDVFDGRRHVVERTLRTGINAAINRGHNETYTEARDELLPELKRMGHEFLMTAAIRKAKGRVNHPFSAYLEGKVAELDQPWRIKSPKFPVMFWSRDGGDYVGMHYPAHLYERGRQVPWHPAWEGSRKSAATRAATAKELQAETEGKAAKKAAKVVPEPPAPAPVEPPPLEAKGRPATGADARAKIEKRLERTERHIDRARLRKEAHGEAAKQIMGQLEAMPQADLISGSPAIRALEQAYDAELAKRRMWQKRQFALEEQRGKAAWKILKADEPARPVIKLNTRDKATAKAWEPGVRAFNELLGPGLVDGMPTQINRLAKGRDQRAYYTQAERAVYMGNPHQPRTVVHELGHWFEYNTPDTQRLAQEFLERRTAGEPPQRLMDLYPGHGYRADEVTKPDNFAHAYVGKVYRSGSTEIVSMGLEEMFADPVAFARRDPDYFDFIYGLVRRGG